MQCDTIMLQVWYKIVSTLPDIVTDRTSRLGFDYRGYNDLSALDRQIWEAALLKSLLLHLCSDDEAPLPPWDAYTVHVYPHLYPNPKTYNIPLTDPPKP